MEKNNIVISGYYGFSNAGDEPMLFAVLRALHYDPKRMRITVISGDPRRTGIHFAFMRYPVLTDIRF